MSETYDFVSVLVDGMPAGDAVGVTDHVLRSAGAVIGPDSMLLLNDTASVEIDDVELVTDPEAALRRLAGWPTFGRIDYQFDDGHLIGVFLDGPEGTGTVNAVGLSVPGRVMDGDPAARERVLDVLAALHRALGADRTVGQFGLVNYLRFSWQDEVRRLRSGDIAGDYDTVDIRS